MNGGSAIMRKELLKGSIDILLLSELSHQDKYGFEITQGIKKKAMMLTQ